MIMMVWLLCFSNQNVPADLVATKKETVRRLDTTADHQHHHELSTIIIIITATASATLWVNPPPWGAGQAWLPVPIDGI